MEQAAATPKETTPVEYMDGIPIGRFPRIVCWWPMAGGGYFLNDPERVDRTVAAGGFCN